MKTTLWVALYDLHFPKVHKPTWKAVMDFISKNNIGGFLFGGDQFDNEVISHHTKGKPLYRPQGAYLKDQTEFQRQILNPLDKALGNAEKVWLRGNHDRFEDDFIEENPELDGLVNRVIALDLAGRGWKVVGLGRSFRKGKLSYIHGEVLTGIGNQAGMFPSKKAVELYSGNVLAGHTHAAQSYTKISPVNHIQKWMGWIAPIAGSTNPTYLRNRPTAWLNGFVIIEYHGKAGNFNLYPVVVVEGRFSYGGKVYSGD